MSGSEEKKLNSLHEEDSLYKAQGGKAAYQISPTYGQNTLYKVNPVHDAWDRALAAESICQDILSSARNQLYLNMRFMDCALSALFFQGDMGVHPVGTDGTVLYYQPEELVGKTLVACTNLAPRKMMGLESCGMLLSAEKDDKLNLLMLDDAIPAGAKLC